MLPTAKPCTYTQSISTGQVPQRRFVFVNVSMDNTQASPAKWLKMMNINSCLKNLKKDGTKNLSWTNLEQDRDVDRAQK